MRSYALHRIRKHMFDFSNPKRDLTLDRERDLSSHIQSSQRFIQLLHGQQTVDLLAYDPGLERKNGA